MKEGWTTKKLVEICELSAGGDVPKKEFSKIKNQEHHIPIYANGEKNNGLYGYTRFPKIKKPSITVSARGTIGFTVKRLESFYPVIRLIVITPKNPYDLDLSYLEHALKTIDFIHSGTSIPQLTVPMIKDYEIPIPPLPEQQRIVSILDRAFAAIDKAKANAEKNLQNAAVLFESYLQDVFENQGEDWEEKSLGQIGKVSMCKRILKKETSNEGEIPFYKIGTFGKEPNAFISKNLYDKYLAKYSYPKKGDILISASGTIGRRVIYDGEPAYFQDSNIVWIDNDEKQVLNDFLYFFYGQCDWNPSRGATISRLYNDDLRKIKINFPTLSEQKDLAFRFSKLKEESEKLGTLNQKKIDALDELKKSLLQKAFEGELYDDEATKLKIENELPL